MRPFPSFALSNREIDARSRPFRCGRTNPFIFIWRGAWIVLAACIALTPKLADAQFTLDDQPQPTETLGRWERRDRSSAIERQAGIVYRTLAGRDLKCDLYLPAGEGPFPAVLVIHGGAWATGSRLHYQRHARILCRRGYAVMAVDYRLAPRHKFPAQVLDVQYAVRWLRHHASTYRIDPERLAAYGYSAGGHLASLLGTADEDAFPDPDLPPELRPYSPRVPVVVAGGAVTDFDWVDEDSSKLAYWLEGSPQEEPERYRLASPRAHVTADDASFYLYHAANDQVVPLECSERMQQALTQVGCHCELTLLKNREHILGFWDTSVVGAVADFLDRQWPAPDPSAPSR